MVGVQARRAAVTYATSRGVSQRRACTLMDVARSALEYCSRLAVKDVARMVPIARRSEGLDRDLASSLQRGAPAFLIGLHDTERVCRQYRQPTSVRACDGADRCATWGLRAPLRRSTAPDGATTEGRTGRSLKLAMVRRNKAGHRHADGFDRLARTAFLVRLELSKSSSKHRMAR